MDSVPKIFSPLHFTLNMGTNSICGLSNVPWSDPFRHFLHGCLFSFCMAEISDLGHRHKY
jgi:hypothetical protein